MKKYLAMLLLAADMSLMIAAYISNDMKMLITAGFAFLIVEIAFWGMMSNEH